MTIAYTICSANYLPFAKSLADSFIAHNPDYLFIIALADTYGNYDSRFFTPHVVVPVTKMEIPFIEEMKVRYTVFELSCALKPSVALYILNSYLDCKTIFYFDSDIMVFGSLIKAETILQNHSLVLTPHITSSAKSAGGLVTELNTLRAGVYNGGFFGINRSEESLMFLKWWEKRLRYYSINDVSNGLFVDQLWLNLSVLYFKSTFILSDPGYNVAYWNFSERRLIAHNENYIINENHPLIFFHYSGYNIHKPNTVSKFQKTLLLENVPEFIPLFQKYLTTVLANNEHDFFSLPLTLGSPNREKNFFKRKFKKMFKKTRLKKIVNDNF